MDRQKKVRQRSVPHMIRHSETARPREGNEDDALLFLSPPADATDRWLIRAVQLHTGMSRNVSRVGTHGVDGVDVVEHRHPELYVLANSGEHSVKASKLG